MPHSDLNLEDILNIFNKKKINTDGYSFNKQNLKTQLNNGDSAHPIYYLSFNI